MRGAIGSEGRPFLPSAGSQKLCLFIIAPNRSKRNRDLLLTQYYYADRKQIGQLARRLCREALFLRVIAISQKKLHLAERSIPNFSQSPNPEHVMFLDNLSLASQPKLLDASEEVRSEDLYSSAGIKAKFP